MNVFDQLEQKRRFRKMLYSKISIIFLLAICVFLAKGLVGVHDKARESMDRRNLSAGRLDQLSAREEQLKKEIERLESRVGLEEELRNRYSFSKDGEKMIVIVDEEAKKTSKKVEEEKEITEKIATWFKRTILVE